MIRVILVLFAISASSFASDLDATVSRIMRGRSGTAVVVDVASGKILANSNPRIAALKLARPGSAFKPFTLLALLQSGKLRPTDAWTCRRTLRVGNHNLACTHPPAGTLNAVSALAYSCNDFFATFGVRLTPEELSRAFTAAGLSSRTRYAAEEARGSISPARDRQERQLQAIGEGNMRVTPLEMLSAYRSLALRRLNGTATDADRTVFAGLEAGTQYGMARLASVEGTAIAGKTGTALSFEGSWTNAWFAGYAPADKPKVAVVVFLENGTGPGDAAPLASEILREWKKAR